MSAKDSEGGGGGGGAHRAGLERSALDGLLPGSNTVKRSTL